MARMTLLAEVSRLTRPLNVRRTLLAAVDAFLEASPPSLNKAHQLVARCGKASLPIRASQPSGPQAQCPMIG